MEVRQQALDMDSENDDDVRDVMTATEASASFLTATQVLEEELQRSGLCVSLNEVPHIFQQADHFVSVVLSRLHRDPTSLEPRLWAFQSQHNRFWALKQQALVGSCEASRGSKAYTSAAAENNDAALVGKTWRPCCFRMVGDSKMKQWQALGEMNQLEAQTQFVCLVTELAPDWMHPLNDDAALLRTWTPDDESDRCHICDETFTLLNRRHHCRRCLNIVCAVCSPRALPLRAFTEIPGKLQRVCNACVLEMEQQRSERRTGTVPLNGKRDDNATPPETLVRKPTYAFSFLDDLNSPAQETDVSPPTPSLLDEAASVMTRQSSLPSSASVVSSTIHCGVLELLHGAGFRKNWHAYFFVLLVRKGSLGMFLSESDHIEKKKRPAAVFKLSGYTIRVKSQKRRPHQFRLTHETKKPLHFAATSIVEMNRWISHLIKAIDNANDLETQTLTTRTQTPSPKRATKPGEFGDEQEDEIQV
ncbi:hypothetical protein Poli38472_007200 [Pythium oligandrum]|uniref:Uncharacterized protein n=1 Tax=Pythium oligandrum TaxID=41045 RepID=A0A8K1FD47_PYTOL|nr:hypothetical protein Poli38472_007200 [Pythium oligandrum]|eukprot:TMW59055.1 hypothetical protein Poli38472_007200 [Pythium oligandrum]